MKLSNTKILENNLIKWSEAYYKGIPLATDHEFDEVLDKLLYLDPKNKIANSVSYGAKKVGTRSKLPEGIAKSLEKIKEADLRKRITKEWGSTSNVVVNLKVDGLHVLLRYKKGWLTKAWTREGIEVTFKFSKIATDILSCPEFDGLIHGEVYIPLNTFAKHLSKQYANPRAAISGIFNPNSSNLNNLKYVRFVGHDPKLPFGNIPSFNIKSAELSRFSEKELKVEYDDLLSGGSFPTDGLVFGGKLAYKFLNESVPAKVGKIKVNLNKTGQLTPVCILKEPVDLYGTKVKRVTALHFKYVKDHKLGSGARIMITKANEIIPQITEVVSPGKLDLPKYCPNCDSTVKWDGPGLYCVNAECRKQANILNFMATYYTCDGFKAVAELKELLEIDSFEELAKLTTAEVATRLNGVRGFGPKKLSLISKMFAHPRLAKQLFLSALGIRNVGTELSESARVYLNKIPKVTPDDFSTLIKARSNAREQLKNNWSIVVEAYKHFGPKLLFYEEI